jgi:hypothetical protein
MIGAARSARASATRRSRASAMLRDCFAPIGMVGGGHVRSRRGVSAAPYERANPHCDQSRYRCFNFLKCVQTSPPIRVASYPRQPRAALGAGIGIHVVDVFRAREPSYGGVPVLRVPDNAPLRKRETL